MLTSPKDRQANGLSGGVKAILSEISSPEIGALMLFVCDWYLKLHLIDISLQRRMGVREPLNQKSEALDKSGKTDSDNES